MSTKSPFPGMDPYLERYWEGVHARMIGYIADDLAPRLPEDLAARIEERVYIDADEQGVSVRRPDVRVVENPLPWEVRRAQGATATVEPVILQLDRDPVTERHLQIIDMDGNRIITAIELLSPANKAPGPGRESFLKKRAEFMASEANVVEIDLVRAGDGLSLLNPFHVPSPYRTMYRASVWRSRAPAKLELYPITLRQPLPKVGIPLRANETDVELDLQPLLDRVYKLSRFDRIDYFKPCEPALNTDEAAWAAELISSSRLGNDNQ